MDIREKKHLVLLGVILLLLGVQPFAHGFLYGFVLFDLLAAVSVVVILLVVFDAGRQRLMMLLLAIPTVASNAMLYLVAEQYHALCIALYCGLAVPFFGLSVAVILRDAFRKEVIASDQMIAGLNGFLIAGVAWGNLFLLIYALTPDAFTASDRVAVYMQNVHARRFEFNHLSFAILTGLGFGDVTPVGRVASTLAWMEAAFALFYMAIIIGLLVSLRMASPASVCKASKPPDNGSK